MNKMAVQHRLTRAAWQLRSALMARCTCFLCRLERIRCCVIGERQGGLASPCLARRTHAGLAMRSESSNSLARSHLFALGVLRRPVAGDGEQRAAASSAWAVEPRDMGCLAWTNPHSRLAVRADEDLGASHTYPSPSSTAPSMRCDEMGQPSAANERRRPAPPSQAHLEKEWALALAGGHNGQIRGAPRRLGHSRTALAQGQMGGLARHRTLAQLRAGTVQIRHQTGASEILQTRSTLPRAGPSQIPSGART